MTAVEHECPCCELRFETIVTLGGAKANPEADDPIICRRCFNFIAFTPGGEVRRIEQEEFDAYPEARQAELLAKRQVVIQVLRERALAEYRRASGSHGEN